MSTIVHPPLAPPQVQTMAAADGHRWYTLARISISTILLGYFAILTLLGALPAESAGIGAAICAIHLMLNATTLFAIHSQITRDARRYFYVGFDQVCLAAVVSATEAAGIPLVVLMLWGPIDAGYRYGIRYLIAAVVMGELALGAAASASIFWRDHVFAFMGFAVAMLVLPALAAYIMVHVARTRGRLEGSLHESQRFIALLGNDLRNPLHALSGHLDLAIGTADLDAVQAHLSAIRQAADTLSAVADNALIYHALQENSLEQRVDQIDITALIRAVRDDLSLAANERRIRINVHEHPNAPWLIEADERCVRLILRNVVEYAVAAGHQGTVDIGLQSAQSDDAGGDASVQISITHDGPPLSSAAREAMFEVYGLDGHTTMGQPPATGLNLYNARKLAQAMLGNIEYSRTRSPGAQLVIVLPARVISTLNERPATASSGSPVVRFDDLYVRHRARVKPQRVLVAEDQRSQQQLLIAILEQAGHSTMLVDNGTDALSQFSNSTFDLALIDLRLPGTSGLDVIRLAKFAFGDRRVRTRFIVVTGDHSDRTRRLCLSAGAMAYLTKPVTPQAVLDTLVRVLDDHDPERLRTLIDKPAALPGLDALGSPPRILVESLRDAMRYHELAVSAGRARNWRGLVEHVRAIRGAVDALGAEHVIKACTRIIEQPLSNVDATWSRELEHVNHLLTDASNGLALLFSSESDPL